MKNMFVALLALALLPATSFAGGGTKGASVTVSVTNSGSDRLAVILDAPAGFDPKRKTILQFKAAGGTILEIGETIQYTILAGKHKYGAAYVSSGGVIGKNTTQFKTAEANSTITATVSGQFNIAPTITVH